MQETGLESQAPVQEKDSGETGNGTKVLNQGRPKTRNSHLKVPQYIPEGLSSFTNWAQMWTMEKANRAEAQLWLRANIVPLMREVGQSGWIKEYETTTDSTPGDSP